MTKIYIAISKETGDVMSGAKGQYAFGDKATLGRSIGQAYGYTAQKKGFSSTKELYDVFEVDVMDAINCGRKL